MSNGTEHLSERDEIEMLLPWYVMGKLPRTDHDRVAAYLANHPDMRPQLALIEEERLQSVRANEAIAAPGGASQARLMARVKSGGAFGLAGLRSKIEEFFAAPSAGIVQWGFAIATVLIVGQAAVIGSLVSSRQDATFETAGREAAAAADGTFALVRFAEAAPVQAIFDTFSELDITIVDGPKPGRLFKVRLGPRSMSEATRNERIGALRAREDIVKFVMPGS